MEKRSENKDKIDELKGINKTHKNGWTVSKRYHLEVEEE